MTPLGSLHRLAVRPAFERPPHPRLELQGHVGARVANNLTGWILPAPSANPAMLQLLQDREAEPRRVVTPWAGEFPGKYLLSAVQAARMNPAGGLAGHIDSFVADLIATQAEDGYLGPHPQSERLTGTSLWHGRRLWDVWGHYHCMLGLLLWSQESGSQAALQACCRVADLLCRTFLDSGVSVLSAGSEEMNMAVSHVLCLLYQETGEERYLRLALQVATEWEAPLGGDYVRTALAGLDFFETPKPRWESLHAVQAIAEMHLITGETHYRRAFEHIWWSILKTDRHNTGGFSSDEQAIGNPYDPRPIETCCTVAWLALSVDMLRLTGDSRVADEIELSTFNAILGAQHPSGRWWTYNTPMDGVRRGSQDEIGSIHAVPGGPELNCCSVNGPRGLGMLSEWGLMLAADGPVVNYYGPGATTVRLPSGKPFRLVQRTDYPLEGEVALSLELASPERFALHLRIPGWSEHSCVAVNGANVERPSAGSYLRLERAWEDGDRVQLSLDIRPHFWAGESETFGKASLYRGPLLLAYDQRFNQLPGDQLPPIDLGQVSFERDSRPGSPQPWLTVNHEAHGGTRVVLCDFASAGAAGTPYWSWVPAGNLSPREFSQDKAVWNNRGIG